MTHNFAEGMAPIDITNAIRNRTLPLCPASNTQFKNSDIERLLWNLMRLNAVPGADITWDKALQIKKLGEDAVGRPAAIIRLVAKHPVGDKIKTASYEVVLCNYCDYHRVCNFQYLPNERRRS